MSRVLVLLSLIALLAGACNCKSSSENGVAPKSTAEMEVSPPVPSPAPPETSAPKSLSNPNRRHIDEEAVAIVRAWSASLNAGDNAAAGALFAPDALLIQSPSVIPLPDLAAATNFMASLPCSGEIVDLRVTDSVVTATFELGDRLTSKCDAAPGSLAAANFVIENGTIVIWQRVPVPEHALRAGSI